MFHDLHPRILRKPRIFAGNHRHRDLVIRRRRGHGRLAQRPRGGQNRIQALIPRHAQHGDARLTSASLRILGVAAFPTIVLTSSWLRTFSTTVPDGSMTVTSCFPSTSVEAICRPTTPAPATIIYILPIFSYLLAVPLNTLRIPWEITCRIPRGLRRLLSTLSPVRVVGTCSKSSFFISANFDETDSTFFFSKYLLAIINQPL